MLFVFVACSGVSFCFVCLRPVSCVPNFASFSGLSTSVFSNVYLLYIQLFVTILTRWVSLVEQKLLTLPEYPSSPPVLVGFVLLDLQFYMYVLQIVDCPFVLFLLAILLSVLLPYTDSDYPFGIFQRLFLNIIEYHQIQNKCLLCFIIGSGSTGDSRGMWNDLLVSSY